MQARIHNGDREETIINIVNAKRAFIGALDGKRDTTSSTTAAVPRPSQGKVKVATDHLFYIIIILMILDSESISFTDY